MEKFRTEIQNELLTEKETWDEGCKKERKRNAKKEAVHRGK
jgi:hypothetical protein